MKPTSREAIERISALHKEGMGLKQIVRILNQEGIAPASAKRWNVNIVRLAMNRHVLKGAHLTKVSAAPQQASIAEIREAVKTFLDLPFSDAKKVEFVRSLFGA